METDRLTELENIKICRICLNSSEEDTFYFDIFESNNDCNASSLPMQILSVGAVEVNIFTHYCLRNFPLCLKRILGLTNNKLSQDALIKCLY